MAFAAARPEVLSGFPYASPRTLHRAAIRPFDRIIRTLLCLSSHSPTLPSSPPTGPCEPLSDASPGDFQRSPLRRFQSKNPLPRRHFCLRIGMYGATVHPRSVFAVSRRPDGFRLFDPARLLRRAPDPEVRGVLSSLRNCRLTTRFRPSKSSPRPELPLPAFAARSRCASPVRCRTVHRTPCLLVLPILAPAHRCEDPGNGKPQGFAPSPGSLRRRPFPDCVARYSLGLATPLPSSRLRDLPVRR